MTTVTSEEIIARRLLAKSLPDGTFLEADAKLYQLGGNARPYFSVTGTHWRSSRDAHGRRPDSAILTTGAIGDLVVKHFPELAPVERLHLADDTGTPMHAEANGWYFYSGDSHEYERTSPYHADPTDTPHERAARTLRVTPDELPHGLTREGFAEYVAGLAERWQTEADEARRALDAR